MQFSFLLAFALSAISLAGAIPVTSSEIAVNSAQGLRLLTLAEGAEPVWKTESEVFALIKAGTHFVGFSFSACTRPDNGV